MHIFHVKEFNKTDQTFLSLQDVLVLNPKKKKKQSLGSLGMETVFITLCLMI